MWSAPCICFSVALVLGGVSLHGCRRQAPEPVLPSRAGPEAVPEARSNMPVQVAPASEAIPSPDVVLDAVRREFPGLVPTPYLFYRDGAAHEVKISGSWDHWHERSALKREGDLWVLDVRPLKLARGRYEYKFVVDGQWENGANRALAVGEGSQLECPPDVVLDARIESPSRIAVYFKERVSSLEGVSVTLDPAIPVRGSFLSEGQDNRSLAGFVVSGDYVIFCFDERTMGCTLTSNDNVTVAGTFNGWNSQSWKLERGKGALWTKAFPCGDTQIDRGDARFKFVINGTRWMGPRAEAPNAVMDSDGNMNFRLGSDYSHASQLRLDLEQPLTLSQGYTVVISNLAPRVIYQPVRPGRVLEVLTPKGELGVAVNKRADEAHVAVFAPRAASVTLQVASRPGAWANGDQGELRSLPLACDALACRWTGSWARVSGARYYGYRVDGPQSCGESFDANAYVGDPYARAVVSENGPCVVVDPGVTNRWFSGWSDSAFHAPAIKDMVIYETHVRDLTIDPSSHVPEPLRGTFSGVIASRGTGTGIDHLRQLGVNMVEFMPVQEFDNGAGSPGWGYSPDYYFAPESAYGRMPEAGSQYYEFKQMVNDLHRSGLGVILDVVFNHSGGASPFGHLDKRVYYRLDADDGYNNFSGCGNDLRTESPAMRKLIVENIVYWIREHHIDGFRFDLAELIDMDTLREIETAARAANPNVVLISEPWSFRGDHKRALRGSGWACWNNEFTWPVRGFIKGEGRSDMAPKAIAGSVDLWTANPLQSVNYFESHDDMALADELSVSPGRDGQLLTETDAARNRIAATLLLTSLGIPMISEGQEFMRSKHGIRNTFANGDAINALRWTDRDRPLAKEALAYYRAMVALRTSADGASLRLAEPAPEGYFDWILPASQKLLGYRINGLHQRPGRAYLVLVNTGDRAETLDIDFSRGRWRLIGDGRQVDPTGVRVKPMTIPRSDAVRIQVPALTALLFSDIP